MDPPRLDGPGYPPRPPVQAPNNWRWPFFPPDRIILQFEIYLSPIIKYKYKYTLPTNTSTCTNSRFQQLAPIFFLVPYNIAVWDIPHDCALPSSSITLLCSWAEIEPSYKKLTPSSQKRLFLRAKSLLKKGSGAIPFYMIQSQLMSWYQSGSWRKVIVV